MYTTPLSTLVTSFSLNHHLYADDTQLFLFSIHHISTATSVTYKMFYNRSLPGWLPIFSVSILLKLNFFWLNLNNNFLRYVTPLSPQPNKQQLSKICDSSLTTTQSARNLGFIFDEHLTFSGQNSALSKSCYYHIHELCCICPYLDFKTASTTATSNPPLSILNSIIVTLLLPSKPST